MKLLFPLCLAFCAGLTTFCGGQEGIKIVSHESTNWDVGFSITYVFGDHVRREGYWGVGTIDPTSRLMDLSLTECGVESTHYIAHGRTFFEENPQAHTTPPPAPPATKGIIRVQIVHVDTGEREIKFGLTVRHVITTEKYDFTDSTCKPDATSRKYDGGTATGHIPTSAPTSMPLRSSQVSIAATV